MSMHKIPLTPIEEAGLRAHGLDIGKPSQLSDAFRQGVRYASAQASQGGEAVEVVASIAVDAEGVVRDFTLEPGLDRHPGGYTVTPLMTVAQHQRILAAATHPADQVADDLTMVKVSRELLQDLRDLAFDQVEHHRAAMGAYKQTRQSAMDSALAQADALLNGGRS